MVNFEFYNPAKIIFGRNVITENTGQQILLSGGKKVLLVAGGGSIKRNGVYDAVVSSLRNAGLEWDELWGVQPNPRLDKVTEGSRYL